MRGLRRSKYRLQTAPSFPALRNPAGEGGRLLYPDCQLRLVQHPFANVNVASVLDLAGAGREWSQRRATEERHLHVVGEHVEG